MLRRALFKRSACPMYTCPRADFDPPASCAIEHARGLPGRPDDLDADGYAHAFHGHAHGHGHADQPSRGAPRRQAHSPGVRDLRCALRRRLGCGSVLRGASHGGRGRRARHPGLDAWSTRTRRPCFVSEDLRSESAARGFHPGGYVDEGRMTPVDVHDQSTHFCTCTAVYMPSDSG